MNINNIKKQFPIFNNNDDIRSILEYHALGQVWLLDSKQIKTEDSLLKILKFSVDILIINLETNYELSGKKLLADKFDFKFYKKVQDGFIKIAKKNKKRYSLIDSNLDFKFNKETIIKKIKKII